MKFFLFEWFRRRRLRRDYKNAAERPLELDRLQKLNVDVAGGTLPGNIKQVRFIPKAKGGRHD